LTPSEKEGCNHVSKCAREITSIEMDVNTIL
jgi:hypothetical protein